MPLLLGVRRGFCVSEDVVLTAATVAGTSTSSSNRTVIRRHTTAVTNNDALSIVTSLVRVTNGYESSGLGPFKNGRCPAVRSSSSGGKNYFRFIGNKSALNEEPRGEGD
jgi:hypothetical protein